MIRSGHKSILITIIEIQLINESMDISLPSMNRYIRVNKNMIDNKKPGLTEANPGIK
jgi:hypothetical protein